ncbi:MAG TPA: SUMF1/EgtB/PvdO family nonheme iron enzyme [Stellaceae bacterium]|nr:SUMF1/EgtB/PvdO family nonheme iron enzyme [Stellaceae bacterium]
MAGEVHPFEGRNQDAQAGDGSRRLAAVLAADMVGFSRLMRADEEGTLARLKRLRRELIDPSIAEHHGRIVKTTGDGMLAVFDSPVEAVRCAVVVQQSMVGRNAALAREQWIQFRVGINLGDIIIDADGDVYGDGVNIAARLETLAEPGGINISGGVYEQIKHKLVCGYQSLGDRKVKNITDPVPVYRVLPDPAAVRRAHGVRRVTAAAVVILLICAVSGAWYLWSKGFIPGAREEIAAATRKAVPLPAAPPAAAPAPASAPPAAASAPPTPAPSPPKPAITEPVLVPILGGSFAMGSNDDPTEKPVHRVTLAPFAIGKYPVTVGQWKECAAAKACAAPVAGGDDEPAANLSWDDAQRYVKWLAAETNRNYRLPSEAEWEYAARGGTETKWWWGNQLKDGVANCRGCGEPYDPKRPTKVGSFAANPFGLYDMGGGVDEWVADCWHEDYRGAPVDGSAWAEGDCTARVLRGGSWKSDPSYLRSSSRDQYDARVRYPTHGFRVARSD